jgi:hypothetical protein
MTMPYVTRGYIGSVGMGRSMRGAAQDTATDEDAGNYTKPGGSTAYSSFKDMVRGGPAQTGMYRAAVDTASEVQTTLDQSMDPTFTQADIDSAAKAGRRRGIILGLGVALGLGVVYAFMQ